MGQAKKLMNIVKCCLFEWMWIDDYLEGVWLSLFKNAFNFLSYIGGNDRSSNN